MSANQNNIVSINTASTSITTGAYVQLSSATPIPTSKISIINNTSSIIKLAYGASGSETDLVAVLKTSQVTIDLGLNVLPSGARLSLEALDATASAGFIAVALLP